jgi:type IV pilus modification protein PilV
MNARTRIHAGYTLIEVLVGMMVFAIGIMALAQLQGSLSKSSTDANARTVATNVAEEIIEAARTFSQITADPDIDAFNNIVDNTETVSRGGIDYSVTTDVTDYYYHPDGKFRESKPNSRVVNADLKRVEVTVAWGAGDDGISFQIDGTRSTTDLGTGSVTLTDLISSYTTGSGAKVVLNSAAVGLYSPPVDYNPGENPDIISIQLGENKFKESTTPLPDVIRTNELVETRFDVVTYSQSDANATFLRREEFRAVSCDCVLNVPNAAGEGGRRPTVWDGNEYIEGEWVAKPFGTEGNNIQSPLCEICCRDHHDGGSGVEDLANDPGRSRYNPFRRSEEYHGEGALAGDHKHYNRDRNGNLVLAESDGAAYVEACRLVRRDGFWRLAQDLRQEGLNSFPADYLDESSEVSEYSDYVTDAVEAYETALYGSSDLEANQPSYEGSPPPLPTRTDLSPLYPFPASTTGAATEMSASGVAEQQLRARGIYVDYMTDELRGRINCLQQPGASGEDCDVPKVSSALEIIPFYDVQLTWLSRWNESPINNPIDVSNQAIADDNTHSRGVAGVTSGFGYSTISSAAHNGNLGLTGTDPVDPWYTWDEEKFYLYALAVDFTTPPPLSGVVVAGSITSSVGGVRAADVEIVAEEAQCDRTSTGFECVIESTAKTPTISVFNYYKAGRTLIACSSYMSTLGVEHVATNGNNKTRFKLPTTASTSVANIVIREGTSC